MKTRLFTGAVVIALFFAGCKGDTGAQGPQGNANVTGGTYAITSWSDNSGDYYTEFSDPDLTADIQDGGAVEAFISIDNGGSWTSIPETYVSTLENAFWSYTYSVGAVRVDFVWNGADDGDPNTLFSATVLVKVVCIAPADVAKMKANHIDMKDYNQVQAYIKLYSK